MAKITDTDCPDLYIAEFTLFHLRNLIIVIMGLWPLGVHPGRLGMSLNDFYIKCNDKEEEETTTHFLGH